MNPLMVSDSTLFICMVAALAVGALIGYCWKEREHAREIRAITRITKRIEEARSAGAKKERAPKDPAHYPSHRLPC